MSLNIQRAESKTPNAVSALKIKIDASFCRHTQKASPFGWGLLVDISPRNDWAAEVPVLPHRLFVESWFADEGWWGADL